LSPEKDNMLAYHTQGFGKSIEKGNQTKYIEKSVMDLNKLLSYRLNCEQQGFTKRVFIYHQKEKIWAMLLNKSNDQLLPKNQNLEQTELYKITNTSYFF